MALSGADATKMPTPDTIWEIQGNNVLTPNAPVTLTWNNGQGLKFFHEVSVDNDFLFTVRQSVENTSGQEATLRPYGLLRRHGEPSDVKNFFILHEGIIRMADGELAEDGYSDVADFDIDPREGTHADRQDVAESGWIGFTDHYWMSVLAPEKGTGFRSTAKYFQASNIYQTEAVLNPLVVSNGNAVSATTQLFVGAKEWEIIRGYEKTGIEGFLDSIDWGWFFFITKPMFAVLHWLNLLIGNMGWAIIGLTLLIKALLFPLAYKSYVSMAKMKELQPEMEKIKKQAGDDRQKMQQMTMKLYQEKKVNPAAGCLPILVQIPIFFSLYKVIFVTLELRHAPWFGWITDLSAPDPSSIWNLFGLLPYSVPSQDGIFVFIALGILPILLGVSMWLQQKLNPSPTDPTQAMIFAWMPWVFMFMLGSFASGLVIYWIANNLITFTQQYLIMRSQGFKPDVFGNIRQSFQRKKAE
jgi:YidC/Oxa1 family membrane protein insertase